MSTAPRWQLWTREAAIWLALIAVYVGLSWISSLHQYKGLLIRPWNPGMGFMLAVIILYGYRYGIALFFGSIATGVIVRHGVLGAPGIIGAAAIIAASYTGAAVAARARFHMHVGLDRLRDVMILLATGIAATVLLAILITAMLLALGRLGRPDLLPAGIRLFVGNVIGIAIMAPLVLLLARRWREGSLAHIARIAPELMLYAALSLLILWVIISIEPIDEFKYFYLLFLPVTAASVRHGLDGACLTLAVVQFGLVALIRRHGYGAADFTEFQVLMFVLTATSLVVGVVVAEREETDRIVRLAEARLKAQEAEAAQTARFSLVSSMASSLAHEMNQPMTAARALARSAQHLLRKPTRDVERAEKNLTDLIAQIDHVTGIVRRTRDFLSRRDPHPSTLETRRLIEETLSLIHADAEARHIEIVTELPDRLPKLHGDRVQLQQVILNLIRNAMDSVIEAFPTPGRIVVAAQHDGDEVVVSVRDNGIGIAEEVADRLFQPLTTSKAQGLGLGLAICASIIESHGGRIWVESSAHGATEFRFALPVATLLRSAP